LKPRSLKGEIEIKHIFCVDQTPLEALGKLGKIRENDGVEAEARPDDASAHHVTSVVPL
tara:strand:- start:47 stop:223 length:177 start_codon:yes stop_codon:yes gene_type:complete